MPPAKQSPATQAYEAHTAIPQDITLLDLRTNEGTDPHALSPKFFHGGSHSIL
jgi:hypothetical protein